MFCIKCGQEIPDGTKFCSKCGAAQSESAPTAPETPAAPQQSYSYGATATQAPPRTAAPAGQVTRQVPAIVLSVLAMVTFFLPAMSMSAMGFSSSMSLFTLLKTLFQAIAPAKNTLSGLGSLGISAGDLFAEFINQGGGVFVAISIVLLLLIVGTIIFEVLGLIFSAMRKGSSPAIVRLAGVFAALTGVILGGFVFLVVASLESEGYGGIIHMGMALPILAVVGIVQLFLAPKRV